MPRLAQCITGCPYKKIYYNHRTGKAEKCTFCYPRIEVGQPTVCSETWSAGCATSDCSLYDADRVTEAASTADEKDLYEAQLDLMLDRPIQRSRHRHVRRGFPTTGSTPLAAPRVRPGEEVPGRSPAAPGVPDEPMVWYAPLSPSSTCSPSRDTTVSHDNLFGAIDTLRIPVEYLAELFTAATPTSSPGAANWQRCGRTCVMSPWAANPTC